MSKTHIIYKFNPEFEKKIEQLAQKLGVKPIEVLAAGVILLEQRLVERVQHALGSNDRRNGGRLQ